MDGDFFHVVRIGKGDIAAEGRSTALMRTSLSPGKTGPDQALIGVDYRVAR